MLDVAIPPAWKRQWNELTQHLRDPFKLRVAMLSAVAAVGLLGIYRPMNGEITILRRDSKTAKERLAMVREIDYLRGSRSKLLENFPERGDINFWTEYLLSGIRDSGVALRTLESTFRKTKVGKLQGVYFDVEVTGTYEQLYRLIAWIESNRYFARVVKLRLKSDVDVVEGKLMVATLVAVQPKPDAKKSTPAKQSHAASAAASKAAAAAAAPAEPAAQSSNQEAAHGH